jgi:hypothetical protein
MKLRTFILLAICILMGHVYGQSCSDLNKTPTFQQTATNEKEHISGNHFNITRFHRSCSYTSINQPQCQVECSDNPSVIADDSCAGNTSCLSNLIQSHNVGQGEMAGSAQGPSCGAASAVAVQDCLFSCSVGVSVGGTKDGLSIQVSFPPTNVWTSTENDSVQCPPVPDPTQQVAGGTGDPSSCIDGVDALTNDPCDLGAPGKGGPTPSPIIIDTESQGFHLTSAQNGVLFDIRGDGHPIQIAWTNAAFRNAFLALPGADGMIHTGKQLFGNFTPQPASPHPNGFLALAEFDKPENGGNGDGVIDERDQVFQKLVLWIDENHDGISQPNELHKLSEFGVNSLSLGYFESRKTDEFGNQFRYRARVNPDQAHRDPRDATATGEPGRWAYDVFFTTK